MNYEQAWNNQRQVAKKLEERLQKIEAAAAAVVAMERDRVNGDDTREPYDPIANPGQFDERIVALAWAIESR
jgi:hypothetical protein